MSPNVLRGSDAFLQQARRNNWQRYLESLDMSSGEGAFARAASSTRGRGWDLCILTASDPSQAEMMRRQLAWRRAQGLLPAQTQFHVIADPSGRRIGSGGATLRILAALSLPEAGLAQLDADPDLLALARAAGERPRALIIHSGGDSRRLPHCSAVGKLFARIPHILPDGRASTIFDEMLINLSGIAAGAPPGALVVSGDVMLVFDHLQVSFHRHGVTGVSIAAPAELGLRHGVYVAAPDGKRVEAFLHKASRQELEDRHAIDAAGTVPIDTGLAWFDASTAAQFASLLADPSVHALTGDTAGEAGGINLYGDLLLPLAAATERQAYLDDASDGPATPAIRAARRVIWSRLRGTPLTVEQLQPAVFIHFGTSEEYWRMVAADEALAHLCGWSRHAAAWLDPTVQPAGDAFVLINAALDPAQDAAPLAHQPALITDSRLPRPAWQGRALIAGLITDRTLTLGADLVLHQLPVAGGFVTRLFGLDDDPKRLWRDAGATFLNRPFADWLAELRRSAGSAVAACAAGAVDIVARTPFSPHGRPRCQPRPGAAAVHARRGDVRLARSVEVRHAPLAGGRLRPGRRATHPRRHHGGGGRHRGPARGRGHPPRAARRGSGARPEHARRRRAPAPMRLAGRVAGGRSAGAALARAGGAGRGIGRRRV